MPRPTTRLCGPSCTDFAEYLRQVRPIPLLTGAEERELAVRLRRDGCEQARERLICANLRLVVYAAKRYAVLGVPLPDLVEAGNVGLIQAVGGFDPDRGARFSTYAMWWIRRSISLALSEHGCLIRVPKGQARTARACREVAQKLSAALGRPATNEEVARGAGLPLATVRSADLTRSAPSVVSGADGAFSLGMVSDRREAAPDEALGTREMREKLRVGLRSLPGQEAEIVRLRFGLGGRAALTVGDISRELGISRDGVSRLLQAALKRLELLLGPAEPAEPVRAGELLATA